LRREEREFISSVWYSLLSPCNCGIKLGAITFSCFQDRRWSKDTKEPNILEPLEIKSFFSEETFACPNLIVCEEKNVGCGRKMIPPGRAMKVDDRQTRVCVTRMRVDESGDVEVRLETGTTSERLLTDPLKMEFLENAVGFLLII
jgi:hypothetical protein